MEDGHAPSSATQCFCNEHEEDRYGSKDGSCAWTPQMDSLSLKLNPQSSAHADAKLPKTAETCPEPSIWQFGGRLMMSSTLKGVQTYSGYGLTLFLHIKMFSQVSTLSLCRCKWTRLPLGPCTMHLLLPSPGLFCLCSVKCTLGSTQHATTLTFHSAYTIHSTQFPGNHSSLGGKVGKGSKE